MGDTGSMYRIPSGTPTIRCPSIASYSPSRRSGRSGRSGTGSPYSRSDKTLRNLVGNWMLSPSLSSDTQGPPQLESNPESQSQNDNTLLSLPSNINITQSHYPSQIFLKSTSGSIPNTERWFPPQRPGSWSDWRNSGSGTRARCRWVKGDGFEHKDGIEFMTHGLARQGEFFEAEEEGRGTKSVEVWFVQSGRFHRRIVRFEGEVRVEGEFVYEFVGR